jgi:hypothetical protein
MSSALLTLEFRRDLKRQTKSKDTTLIKDCLAGVSFKLGTTQDKRRKNRNNNKANMTKSIQNPLLIELYLLAQ